MRLLFYLAAARLFERRLNWQRAVAAYKRYFSSRGCGASSRTYEGYMRCLRFTGDIEQAKQRLLEGQAVHPHSESLWRAGLWMYIDLAEWPAAERIAERLVELAPEQTSYYWALGRIRTFQFDKVGAKNAFTTGLVHHHAIPFTQLLGRLSTGFPADADEYRSEYMSITGKNNLGGIVHESSGGKYFTKIMLNEGNKAREVAIYRDILPHVTGLQGLCPRYVDAQLMDDIWYLTLEYIEPGLPKVSLPDAIAVCDIIGSFGVGDVPHEFPDYSEPLRLTRHVASLRPFFAQIHVGEVNAALFKSAHGLVKNHEDPGQALQVLRHLEKCIMDARLYELIDPATDYRLLHGDFHRQNTFARDSVPNLVVFDWAPTHFGPRFLDIARYASASSISYALIKKYYLTRDDPCALTDIERIFFLYAYVFMHLIQRKSRKFPVTMEKFITPALGDLDAYIAKVFQPSHTREP